MFTYFLPDPNSAKIYLQGISAYYMYQPDVTPPYDDVFTSTLEFQGDGDALATNSLDGVLESFVWLLSGSASDYDVKFDIISGDTPTISGGSFGIWQSAAGYYAMYFSVTGTTTKSAVIDVSVGMAGLGVPIMTTTWTISIEPNL